MNRIKCISCGLVNFDTEANCRRCQNALRVMPGASPPVQTQTGPPSYEQPPMPAPQAASYSAPTPEPTTYSAPYTQTTTYNPPPIPAAPYNPPPMQAMPYPTPLMQQAAPYSASPETSPPAYAAPYYPMPTPVKLKEGMAIASLVLGCIGFFSWGLCGIGAITGLILGIVALNKANKLPMEYGGKGLAIAGICTNSLMFISAPIMAAIVIPNLMASRMAANEAAAISHLRKIASAEVTYQSTRGAGSYGTIDDLIKAGLLDAAASQKSGYEFVVVPSVRENPYNRKSTYIFEAHAVPMAYGSTGKRSFSVTESFEIHAADRHGRQLQGDGETLH